MEHRWTALGGGSMTTEQANAWVEAPPDRLVEEPLAIHVSAVVCAVCLRDHAEDPPELCLGLPDGDDAEHVWQVFMTAMVTRDEADQWAGGGGLAVANPQSTAVVCLLCGSGAGSGPSPCPERELWT